MTLEMPPVLTWFSGRDSVLRFVASQGLGQLDALACEVFAAPRQFRMVPAMANGQPAFAAYERGTDGAYRAHALLVLTITPAGIARIVIFLSPDLFAAFGLPQEYGAAAAGSAPAPEAGLAASSPPSAAASRAF